MKKSVLTLLAIAYLFLGNVTVANAQNDFNYNRVRENVLGGDENYRSGAWTTAITMYEWALRDNGQCGNHKYISDAEIEKKIDDCKFALQHDGKTRGEYYREQRENNEQDTQATYADDYNEPHHHHHHHSF